MRWFLAIRFCVACLPLGCGGVDRDPGTHHAEVGGTGGQGIGGGSAGVGTGGAAGAAGQDATGARPAWAPVGVFPPEIEALLAATYAYAEAICCQLTAQGLTGCIPSELNNFAPSIEWLVRQTRRLQEDPNYSSAVLLLTADFLECAGNQTCTAFPLPCVFREERVLNSSPWQPLVRECPDGTPAGRQCDAQTRCADGYDERNCDPSAPSFDCGGVQTIPWLSICDGLRDCANGDDEFRCEAP